MSEWQGWKGSDLMLTALFVYVQPKNTLPGSAACLNPCQAAALSLVTEAFSYFRWEKPPNGGTSLLISPYYTLDWLSAWTSFRLNPSPPLFSQTAGTCRPGEIKTTYCCRVWMCSCGHSVTNRQPVAYCCVSLFHVLCVFPCFFHLLFFHPSLLFFSVFFHLNVFCPLHLFFFSLFCFTFSRSASFVWCDTVIKGLWCFCHYVP